MLFMVIEHFKNGDPKPVGDRFRRSGRMLPEGVVCIASWIDSPNSGCFQIMEHRIGSHLTRGSQLGMIWWILRSFRSKRQPSSGRRFNPSSAAKKLSRARRACDLRSCYATDAVYRSTLANIGT
jgi:hypothetical protein